MKVLIVNPGSTSVKYSFFDAYELVLSRVFSRKNKGFEVEEKAFLADLDFDYAAFRVVHALDQKEASFIDETILNKIKEAESVAPLHNKKTSEIIEFLMKEKKDVQLFAAFDTEFHKNMPEYAKLIPINRYFAEKYKIEKYGFHGLAFESALSELQKELGYLPERIVAIHAGGGVSVCAISDGVSQDTTMSFTPTDGVMMLTRSGAVDPGMIRFLIEKENLAPHELYELLNHKSGFYGLTDSKDTKEIIDLAKKGKESYKSAYQLFLYQLKKQIFAYMGVLGSVDLVLLSGGLAYNNEYFADDLFAEIKHLPIRREQIVKVKVDENRVILDKLKEKLIAY